MIRVLLIQSVISSYRVPVYNLLARKYDLTVAYSYGNIPKDIEFKIVNIPIMKVWKFTIYRQRIEKMAREYDVIIAMMAPQWLGIYFLPNVYKRRFKFITWGIGVPASYSVRYDDPKKNLFPLVSMIKKSDAAIFYSDYPVEKYRKIGIDQRKLFVAHNTVSICNVDYHRTKDSYLFVGTLYKEKGINVLLQEYQRLVKSDNLCPRLVIIGGGAEYEKIQDWITRHELIDKVIMTGPIYDEHILAEYFSRAILCISPVQAGLSVQKAMGYGVPFVTSSNSFTGGERLDIVHGKNGLLFENNQELFEILVDASRNKEKYIEMGKNAKCFYDENRTIQIMANGVIEAVQYALGGLNNGNN